MRRMMALLIALMVMCGAAVPALAESYTIRDSTDTVVAEIELPPGYDRFIPSEKYDSNYNGTGETDYSRVRVDENADAYPFLTFQLYEGDYVEDFEEIYGILEGMQADGEEMTLVRRELDVNGHHALYYVCTGAYYSDVDRYEGGVYTDGYGIRVTCDASNSEEEGWKMTEEHFIEILKCIHFV